MKKTIFACLLVAASSMPASAGAFWGGTVIDVKSWDVLNIRAWPSSSSNVIDSYDNGDHVSLLGRCKNIVTNVSFQIDGGQSASWKHKRMKASNVWCQVFAPNVEKVGWVRGAFVWPE